MLAAVTVQPRRGVVRCSMAREMASQQTVCCPLKPPAFDLSGLLPGPQAGRVLGLGLRHMWPGQQPPAPRWWTDLRWGRWWLERVGCAAE
jgi:hypothetical protein